MFSNFCASSERLESASSKILFFNPKRREIAKALEELDEGKAESRLEKLLENKWKSLKDDPQGKMKLIRFALGRGYGYEDISSLLGKVCRNDR